jgi:SAM-dependent methyltransferase
MLTDIAAVRELLRQASFVAKGNGGEVLKRKRKYHSLLADATRALMAQARVDDSLFVENRCPVCERRERNRQFANPLGLVFTVCRYDGTVYMDPVPTDRALASIYDSDAEAYHFTGESSAEQVRVQPRDRPDFDALMRWVGYTPRHRRLLDVGCSVGGFLLTCRDTFDVAGVELNSTTANIARRHGLDVRTGRLADVEATEAFDLITMLQVIEHVISPLELMAQARARLVPGGYLYVNTPNVDSASFSMLGPHHVHVRNIGHVSLLTRDGLLELGRRAGLELVAHEYCGGRDLALHDILTFRLARGRFAHRMASYAPRFYHACNLVDRATGAIVPRLFAGRGHESYQRALLRKPPAVT